MVYLTLSEISYRVREEIDEKGLKQGEIAEDLGVSQPAVSSALDGESKHRNLLFRIARRLGFTVGKKPLYRFEEP